MASEPVATATTATTLSTPATTTKPPTSPTEPPALYTVKSFHTGVWRTSSLGVREHTETSTAPQLARTLASALAREAPWAFALGRSLTSTLELRDRLRPFLQRELEHTLHQGPDATTVLSDAQTRCVGVFRRRRKGGLRIALDLFKCWPVTDALHALQLMRELEKHHPDEMHVYLQAFAALPESDPDSVMKEMTTRLDREGTPCYVECEPGDVVSFYLRHGFDILHRRIPGLPKGSPILCGLLRKPRDVPSIPSPTRLISSEERKRDVDDEDIRRQTR